MNIRSHKGTKIVYVGVTDEQVNWGNCDDPRLKLVLGHTYTVDHTEIHRWHTKVILQEVEGKFPSVAFKEELK